MTVGPALILLDWARGRRLPDWVNTFGRVPMFYYVLHLWTMHTVTFGAAVLMGYPLAAFDVMARYGGRPEGFGSPLWTAPALAAVAAALLYPLCRWYDRKRQQRRWAWTRYF
jgi:hypothetical protein